VEESIPVGVSKRKAGVDRLRDFQALADYANLGDTLDEWRSFRLKWPHFLSDKWPELIYENAESWFMHRVPLPVWDFMSESLMRSLEALARTVRERQEWLHSIPTLLWYRNLLRVLWLRQDQDGMCLMHLLGIDESVSFSFLQQRLSPGKEIWGWPFSAQLSSPVIQTSTGRLEFDSQFQRLVYDLMRDREKWRATLCPVCGKFFVAEKTHQRYCSTKCFEEIQRKRALTNYFRNGRAARKARALQAKSQRQIS